MAEVVKVVPSMNAEQAQQQVQAVLRNGGSLGLSMNKSTHGIELLEGELEEFSCEYKANGRVTDGFILRLWNKIKYYMTCQCLCECYVPQKSWAVQICVTNKRLILRERMNAVEPGTKKCMYYVTCMCMCPKTVQYGYEEQVAIDLKDIKDYKFLLRHRNSQLKCLCCLCYDKVEESFKVKLFCTKTIGETRLGWLHWAIDKDNKTYAGIVELEGILSKAHSTELRKVLHAVAARNAASNQVSVLQKEGKADPIQFQVNLS